MFGRVTPHQKRAMVGALQSRGHTVAMTGDGVNDVLALKDANCGVAMASGSEATRGVAQLVLMDSNFSAMPAVVAEGRRVINNIERVASLFLAKTDVLRRAVGPHRRVRARLSPAADPPVDPQLVHHRPARVLPRPRAERSNASAKASSVACSVVPSPPASSSLCSR